MKSIPLLEYFVFTEKEIMVSIVSEVISQSHNKKLLSNGGIELNRYSCNSVSIES